MTVSDELRQAADKLTEVPHCGGAYSDCACDYAEQLAGLLRDYASLIDEDPDWAASIPDTAMDIVRRINRFEVSA